jgi:hypothetical protein
MFKYYLDERRASKGSAENQDMYTSCFSVQKLYILPWTVPYDSQNKQ